MKIQRKHWMKSLTVLLAAVTLVFAAPFRAWAVDVKVIANASVTVNTISAVDLKRVYLQQGNSLVDGTHVGPILRKDGAIHNAFLKQYLDISDEALQTYYRTLVFTGRGSMPRTLDSDAEVVAYVVKTRGAIGYVSSETDTSGAKVLAVLTEQNPVQRALLIHVEPDYPETLQHLQIGGTVRLLVTISPKGNVETVELLGGNPILGESAITAVRRWVYLAGRSRTKLEVTILFTPHS